MQRFTDVDMIEEGVWMLCRTHGPILSAFMQQLKTLFTVILSNHGGIQFLLLTSLNQDRDTPRPTRFTVIGRWCARFCNSISPLPDTSSSLNPLTFVTSLLLDNIPARTTQHLVRLAQVSPSNDFSRRQNAHFPHFYIIDWGTLLVLSGDSLSTRCH